MRARNALGQLSEQRVNDLLELLGLDDVQNLLHLAKEHHLKVMREYSLTPPFQSNLFGAASFGPEFEQCVEDLWG